MNNNDPFLLRILDLIELADLTVVDDIAFISTIRIDAAQNVHQRGFTRPVFSHQGMDLAFFHLQIYVVKGLDAGESFGNILHLK